MPAEHAQSIVRVGEVEASRHARETRGCPQNESACGRYLRVAGQESGAEHHVDASSVRAISTMRAASAVRC